MLCQRKYGETEEFARPYLMFEEVALHHWVDPLKKLNLIRHA